MALKLLLVEDDPALGNAVASALRQSGYVVDIAVLAADAMRLATATQYDGGILDLGLPDRDGIELLRDMRRSGVAFPLLILTARDGVDDRVSGLDNGADDYLVKPFALAELEARLRAVLRRNEDKVPWRQVGRLRFDLAGSRVLCDGEEIELTRREFAVLESLSRRVGRVVPKEALFEAVFPYDTDVGPNAMEVHVSRLRRKIEPAGVSIRALRGLGYRLEEQPAAQVAQALQTAAARPPQSDVTASPGERPAWPKPPGETP